MLLTLRVELVICNAALSPAKLSFFSHDCIWWICFELIVLLVFFLD